MDFLMLIIWVVVGLINFVIAEKNDYQVSFISYCLMWMVLILELVKNIV